MDEGRCVLVWEMMEGRHHTFGIGGRGGDRGGCHVGFADGAPPAPSM